MAYQIKCDGFILDDPRDDSLTVQNPVVNLEVNTVGGCTFTILKNHPYYDVMKKLVSVFEVTDDVGVVFRGRMTEDTADFYNSKAVDIEGAMAYFNDSVIRPFNFPDDFTEDPEYETLVIDAGWNVVKFFLKWLIDRHNEQVTEAQKFKLGEVTVADPNNYISRSSTDYASTWETLKSKLFDSSLGGYLCIRYEADGNYIDYLSDFTLTNPQKIEFGKNLLDLKSNVDASGTYSVILPLGANFDTETTDKDGNATTTRSRLTIASLPDGDITDDIVKSGDLIYSKKLVKAYGWICAPIKETTWDDVTDAENLKTKAVTALSGDLSLLSSTIDATALDLHFTDAQVQTFRIYRKVIVESEQHGYSGTYNLTRLSLNLHSFQNSKLTVGRTDRTLTDINGRKDSETDNRIENVEKDIAENRSETTEMKNKFITLQTQIINDCQQIILSALESYVETSYYEQFRQTVESELKVMADSITMNFNTTTEQINDVDGDLQVVMSDLEKHFEFTIDGLIIKAGENAMQLFLDNDMIRFTKNGQEFGWWDGVDFHTGNIVVDLNERAQFGNFAFIPRSNGSLDFLKVGG